MSVADSSPLETPTPARPSRRAVIAVLVVAGVIRAAMLAAFYENLQDDPDAYVAFAAGVVFAGVYGDYEFGSWRAHILPTSVHPAAWRPPLYPLLLTNCVRPAVDFQLTVASLHWGLGVATVWLVIRLGVRFGLRHFSLLAALLVAGDPILLQQSTLIMTETLATFLVALGLLFLARYSDDPTAWHVALAGAILGLAALCRPTFYVWLVVCAFAVFLSVSGRLRCASLVLAFCLSAAAVVAPWAARNYRVYGRPIVSTTHGGYTFRLGNNAEFYEHLRREPFGTTWQRPWTNELSLYASIFADNRFKIANSEQQELVKDELFYEDAFQTIREQPGMFAYSCLIRVGRLWQLVPHRTKERDSPWHTVARYAIGVWYFGVLALAAVGVWRLGRRFWRTPWLWGVLLCASFTLVHTFYWSNMRMRAPLAPVIACTAAAGWMWIRTGRKVRKSLLSNDLNTSDPPCPVEGSPL
jgi:4-amino-4-deoxy-L-arabinose transferase-like glycosyltransferase